MLDIVLLTTMHSTGVIPNSENYSEALAQAAYLDEHGASRVVIGEHHNTANSYIPSPMLLAAAMAARTKNIRFDVMNIAPLHQPIRIAEDVLVLDNISGGRVDLSIVLGYRKSEYAMFGTKQSQRVRRAETAVEVLRKVFAGGPFEYEGQTIEVTPRPVQPNGPPLLIGGAADISAKRAARIGDGYFPSGGAREDMVRLRQVYLDECAALGKEPGRAVIPNQTIHVQVSEDPERTWAEIGPFCFSDVDMYSRWAFEAGDMSGAYSSQQITVEQLAASGLYRVLTPDQCVEYGRELAAQGDSLVLSPHVGGLPPKIGWEGLELFVQKVLPRLDPTGEKP